jgi:peptide/histidine transporter 3/4
MRCRFYWSINLGAIISYTVVCYICQYGIPQLGGVRWGFFAGYMIPCVAMALAIAVFMWGLPRYKLHPPRGSAVTRSFGLVFEAVSIAVQNFLSREPRSSFQDIFDHVLVENGGRYTEKEVGAVRLLLRLVPFLAALIPYSSIYTQMSTAFQNQACQMDLSLGDTGFSIPPSALNFFDSVAILLLVPVFDRYLYPRIETWTGKRFTTLRKLGCGFTFALLSMVAAALIELWRYSERAEPATYLESEAARSNISPCHDIYDYNPFEYQKYLAGLVNK